MLHRQVCCSANSEMAASDLTWSTNTDTSGFESQPPLEKDLARTPLGAATDVVDFRSVSHTRPRVDEVLLPEADVGYHEQRGEQSQLGGGSQPSSIETSNVAVLPSAVDTVDFRSVRPTRRGVEVLATERDDDCRAGGVAQLEPDGESQSAFSEMSKIEYLLLSGTENAVNCPQISGSQGPSYPSSHGPEERSLTQTWNLKDLQWSGTESVVSGLSELATTSISGNKAPNHLSTSGPVEGPLLWTSKLEDLQWSGTENQPQPSTIDINEDPVAFHLSTFLDIKQLELENGSKTPLCKTSGIRGLPLSRTNNFDPRYPASETTVINGGQELCRSPTFSKFENLLLPGISNSLVPGPLEPATLSINGPCLRTASWNFQDLPPSGTVSPRRSALAFDGAQLPCHCSSISNLDDLPSSGTVSTGPGPSAPATTSINDSQAPCHSSKPRPVGLRSAKSLVLDIAYSRLTDSIHRLYCVFARRNRSPSKQTSFRHIVVIVAAIFIFCFAFFTYYAAAGSLSCDRNHARATGLLDLLWIKLGPQFVRISPPPV